MRFNDKKYLARINYHSNVEPTLEHLRDLQAQHLFTIPFENWDIHDKVIIELDIDKIFQKIVVNGKGGFCYELGGLFHQLLLALGFQAKLISAQVYSSDTKKYGLPFDHLAIIVTLEGVEYLVDVGFGEFALHPLVVEQQTLQNDKRGTFQIIKDGTEYIVSKQIDGECIPEYKFESIAHELSKFAEMCFYHQTSPQSHFTRKRMMTLATETGRNTVSGNTLIIRENDVINEQRLSDIQATSINLVKQLVVSKQ